MLLSIIRVAHLSHSSRCGDRFVLIIHCADARPLDAAEYLNSVSTVRPHPFLTLYHHHPLSGMGYFPSSCPWSWASPPLIFTGLPPLSLGSDESPTHSLVSALR